MRSPLARKAVEIRRSGPHRLSARVEPYARTSDAADATATIAGRYRTGYMDRKNASRVALAPTW
jgi:hypothetical protein